MILYYMILYYMILYCIVLYSTVLYDTVLYDTVLYDTVLHCSILYYTAEKREEEKYYLRRSLVCFPVSWINSFTLCCSAVVTITMFSTLMEQFFGIKGERSSASTQ